MPKKTAGNQDRKAKNNIKKLLAQIAWPEIINTAGIRKLPPFIGIATSETAIYLHRPNKEPDRRFHPNPPKLYA
jgi:hypothetical protein